MKSNQFVLITGAGGSISNALARLFAADGWNLMLVAGSSKVLAAMTADLTQEFKIDIIPIAKNLFVPENVTDLYKEASTTGIEIEILINNAAEEVYKSITDADPFKEQEVLRLCTESTVMLTGLFLKDMGNRGHGKILNIAAIGSPVPASLQPVYRAIAAFTDAYTDAIKKAAGGKGITIHSLSANNNAGVSLQDAYAALMKS